MNGPALTEREWQALVVSFARLHGWWVYHPFDSRRSEPGWPDLTFVRGPELVFAELKRDRGRVSAEQQRVLELLAATGAETHVWRPADEPMVFARLARAAGVAA